MGRRFRHADGTKKKVSSVLRKKIGMVNVMGKKVDQHCLHQATELFYSVHTRRTGRSTLPTRDAPTPTVTRPWAVGVAGRTDKEFCSAPAKEGTINLTCSRSMYPAVLVLYRALHSPGRYPWLKKQQQRQQQP